MAVSATATDVGIPCDGPNWPMMGRIRATVTTFIALATGCGFSSSVSLDAGFDGGSDALLDATDPVIDTALPDGPAAVCTTWHAYHFKPCNDLPAPGTGLTIDNAATYNTDSATFTAGGPGTNPPTLPLTQVGGEAALVMSVASLTVTTTGSLHVVGTRPLVIATWDTITIAGTIDASSTRVNSVVTAGAGAGSPACSAATAGHDEVDNGGGSGGGGGGGFPGAGGMGGPGDSGAQNMGGAGATANPTIPTIVHGGCSGAASGKAGPDGNVVDHTAFTAGGFGGGAVQLSARTSITIAATGRLVAAGLGGTGTASGEANGGGGGGSGGFLGLDAPTLTITAGAIVAANGGGGGGSNGFAAAGAPGESGHTDALRANGGAASGCSFAGGFGGALAPIGGDPAVQTTANCGGGGGGGGAGYIVIVGTATTYPATLSPAASFLAPP